MCSKYADRGKKARSKDAQISLHFRTF